MQTCEVTNRNCIEGLACGASWHMTTKPFGAVSKVNAALVHGKMMFLLGELCFTSGIEVTVKPAWPCWNQKEPSASAAASR